VHANTAAGITGPVEKTAAGVTGFKRCRHGRCVLAGHDEKKHGRHAAAGTPRKEKNGRPVCTWCGDVVAARVARDLMTQKFKGPP
jgi:hypothetical protein